MACSQPPLNASLTTKRRRGQKQFIYLCFSSNWMRIAKLIETKTTKMAADLNVGVARHDMSTRRVLWQPESLIYAGDSGRLDARVLIAGVALSQPSARQFIQIQTRSNWKLIFYSNSRIYVVGRRKVAKNRSRLGKKFSRTRQLALSLIRFRRIFGQQLQSLRRRTSKAIELNYLSNCSD